MKLLLRLVYPLTVLTVHDEHEALRTGIVVSPERADLVLASDVPHVEPHVLVCHGLDVEPDCERKEKKKDNEGKDERKENNESNV